MTIREAVELVLQAGAIAATGEVLVLDMGEPVKIMALARRLIRMAGLVPGRDIEIVETGKRPGEKLTEVLSAVPLLPSIHSRIFIADQGWPGPVTLFEMLQSLIKLAADGNRIELRNMLLAVASNDWQPSELVDLNDPPQISKRAVV